MSQKHFNTKCFVLLPLFSRLGSAHAKRILLCAAMQYTVTTIDSVQSTRVICKCATVEGTVFWLSIPGHSYTGTIEYLGENTTSGYDDQYFKEPIRVHGHMTTFGDEADNPPAHLKDTLMLSIAGDQSSID